METIIKQGQGLKKLVDDYARWIQFNQLGKKAITLMDQLNDIREDWKTLKKETACRPITADDLLALRNMILREYEIHLEIEELDRKFNEIMGGD